jgi:diguanylate cyclase (GGDEF)-like protein/PAS domain S-box-containing protein
MTAPWNANMSKETPLQPDEFSVYEAAIHKSIAIGHVALAHISDAVLIADREGLITHLNPVAVMLTGWPSDEAIGRPMEEVFCVINGTTKDLAANPARRAMAENRIVDLAANSLLVQRDGSELAIEDSAAPVLDPLGAVVGVVIIFHDIRQSQTRVRLMEHLAQHDLVTGLPNRELLLERTERAIGLARRHRKLVGMLFIDLDAFKGINDSLGHLVGDELIRSVANALQAAVRDSDTVSRAGGDEFLVLLSEIETTTDAANVANKLLAALMKPHQLSAHAISVAASIGIAVFPIDGTTFEQLISHADVAMYEAKARGGNCYQFYGDHNGGHRQSQTTFSDLDYAPRLNTPPAEDT